jgi:hypothetical protein
MQQLKTRHQRRTAVRMTRPSLSPYLLDEVALTLSEVREARSDRRRSS